MTVVSYQNEVVIHNNDSSNPANNGSSNKKIKVFVGILATAALFLLYTVVPSASLSHHEQEAKLLSFGKRAIGDGCFFDASCESTHCNAGFFSRGFCVECMTDNDCEGQGVSLAGELPKAFCFSNDDDDDTALPRCSEWKMGKPIDDRGYPVWLDGAKDATWIKRNVMPQGYGPVMEQVWHWDIANQPDNTNIEVNGTHVLIPLNAHTIAGYSRTYNHYNEHETGVVTAVFLNNPLSVITPYAVGGMIEKYHTLTYDGNWSTARADRVRAERAARDEETERRAKAKRVKRSYLMAHTLGATYDQAQQVESAQDDLHLNQIRDHVKELLDRGTSDSVFETMPGYATHSRKAVKTLGKAKSLTSLKSENHCKHFEEGSGVEVTDTHMVIPLDKAITTISGEMVFAPTYYFGLISGFTVAKYDKSTNSLDIYYQGYQAWRQYTDVYLDASVWPYPSGLYVSPIIGNDNPVPAVDGRSDQWYSLEDPKVRFTLEWMVKKYLTYPIDYDIFDDRETYCPPELEEELEPVWDDAQLEIGESSGNVLSKLFNLKALLHVVVEGVPCASNYMKADYGPGVVGFDANEYGVFGHLILEIDAEHTGYLATSDFWDDWKDFLSGGSASDASEIASKD